MRQSPFKLLNKSTEKTGVSWKILILSTSLALEILQKWLNVKNHENISRDSYWKMSLKLFKIVLNVIKIAENFMKDIKNIFK